MKNKFLFMVAFVFLLGTFYTGILVVVDYLTAPVIEKNERVALQENVLGVFEIEFEDENLAQVFSSRVDVEKRNNKQLFFSERGDIAFRFEGSGLWGPIEGIIALESDMERIKNLAILRHQETPGLGGRIEESEFLAQFRGVAIKPSVLITAPGEAAEDNQVDGITAATMTGDALEKILNLQIERHLEALK